MGRKRTKGLLLCAVAAWLAIFGPAFAAERFTDNGDGTVTDHEMGLMWAASTNQGNVDWEDAERYCKYGFPSTLGKHDNWRMPTIEELQSLYVQDPDYEGYETPCGQTVKSVPEIRMSCGWIWSSEKKSITARVYNFQRGYHYTDRRVHKRHYRALPVRNLTPAETQGR